MKAYLIWNGWRLKKIHDLENLLAYAIEFDSDFEDLREECKLLDEYIEEDRYPGDLPWEAIGERDAYEAFEAAEKISRFVLARITFEED